MSQEMPTLRQFFAIKLINLATKLEENKSNPNKTHHIKNAINTTTTIIKDEANALKDILTILQAKRTANKIKRNPNFATILNSELNK